MKTSVAIIFGGKSTEHEISLRSAKSIINTINRDLFEVTLIGINKQGVWNLFSDVNEAIDDSNPVKYQLKEGKKEILLRNINGTVFISETNGTVLNKIDVAFPVLHGSFGEDGTIQGLFKFLNLAFVGVDVMASAMAMDKDITKRLLRNAGIPVAKGLVLYKHLPVPEFVEVSQKLGLPMFIKPANAGSSVGVHKVAKLAEWDIAIKDAFLYDTKILIEEAIVGIEVECAVLGNENPQASVLGEIAPTEQFYSYDAKYVNTTGAKLGIPANIPTELSDKIRATAIKAFKAIAGEGLSRVDFFLKQDNTFLINEINTMPGFTSISMYPKMWEATGIPYSELITKLINLGLERFQKEQELRVSF